MRKVLYAALAALAASLAAVVGWKSFRKTPRLKSKNEPETPTNYEDDLLYDEEVFSPI